jgi:hypothetical protein
VINLAVADDNTVRSPRTSRDTLLALLAEIESLLLGVRTDQYATRTGAVPTTIGQQVARCLAGIASLFAGTETGAIRYTTPSHDLAVDPVAALKRLRVLRAGCGAWPPVPLATVVRVEHATAAGDESDTGWSTLDAEAAFVISETIDAQRLIAAALRARGAAVPDGFGDTPLPTLTARMSSPPVWALWKRLDEISALLLEIPLHVYTAPVGGHVSGTLGAHVRHCLDHVSALVSAERSTTLSYDRRRRGTSIEADPAAALQQILRLKAALERCSARSLDEPMRVASQIDRSGASIVGWSTFGRELAFVLSHTIHHQATMAAVLALHGVDAPDGFGYAPSTPQH